MNIQRRLAAAARWFIRWRDEANGGEVSGKFGRWLRRKAFQRWLRSKENAAAYTFITAVHAALERRDLKDRRSEAVNSKVVSIAHHRGRSLPPPAIAPSPPLTPATEPTPARAQLSRRRLIAASAVLLVGGGVALTSVIRTRRDDLIASGHMVQIGLREGVMHAARNTLFRLDPSQHAHTVHLLNGQAAFHVWHGASTTTRVTASLGEVFAVAAKFSVLALETLLKVTVGEGSIHLVHAWGQVILHAGEQLTIRAEDTELPSIVRVDAEREFAWMQGTLWFAGEALEEAAATLNRFNELQIVFSAALARLKVTQRCALNDPERFVKRLAIEQKLAWRRDGKRIRIFKRDDSSGV